MHRALASRRGPDLRPSAAAPCALAPAGTARPRAARSAARRPARALLGALSLLLLAPLGCDKGEGPASATPGAGGGSPAKGSGVVLRYAAAAKKLTQTTTFEFTSSGGGQYGEMKLELVAGIELVPEGDKLKVLWAIRELPKVELKGNLEPKAEAGKPAPPDPKTVLLARGKGAFVTDLLGEGDEDATKALAENEADRKKGEEVRKAIEEARAASKDPPADAQEWAAGAQLVGLVSGVFNLPGLPEAGLKPGKKLTVEKEEETPLGEGGPVLPIESETTYLLVKVDEAGGKKIAEVAIESEASGATEMQGGMLVVDQATEATLLFDLDAGLPVELKVTTTQSFSFGEQTFEATNIATSTFREG